MCVFVRMCPSVTASHPGIVADVMDAFSTKLFFFRAVVIEFDINVFDAAAAADVAIAAAVTVRPP